MHPGCLLPFHRYFQLTAMLTGFHPFDARSAFSRAAILEGAFQPAGARAAGIPPKLDAILARAMAKAPDDRFQGMEELLAESRRLRENGQAAASNPYVNALPRRPGSGTRVLAPALLLAIVAFLVYYFLIR